MVKGTNWEGLQSIKALRFVQFQDKVGAKGLGRGQSAGRILGQHPFYRTNGSHGRESVDLHRLQPGFGRRLHRLQYFSYLRAFRSTHVPPSPPQAMSGRLSAADRPIKRAIGGE